MCGLLVILEHRLAGFQRGLGVACLGLGGDDFAPAKKRPIRIRMMPMTTRSSMRVKAVGVAVPIYCQFY